MKLQYILPIATCALVSIVHAAGVAAPFIDDLDAAKKQAKAEHKDILVDFTGSDWCGYCIALDKEVFHTPEYIAGAPGHFISVQLDFPNRTKLPADIEARNNQWKEELKSGSFPDVLLLDENGKVYADTGYRAGGSKLYLEHIESLRQRRIQRDAALALAEKADGLEKARHLDAALTALREDELITTHYGDMIKQVLVLDSEDKAGLKTKYNDLYKRRKCEYEIAMLIQGGGDKALVRLKEYAAKPDIAAESKQYALYTAGNVAVMGEHRDYSQGIEFYRQAVAAAPDSPLVESRLKDSIAHYEPMAKESGSAAMFNKVEALRTEKRYDEALVKIDEFMLKLSEVERSNMQRRQWAILVEKGPIDAALAKLKQASEEEPSNSELQCTMGLFLLNEECLKDHKAAVALAHACAKRVSDNPKAQRSPAFDAFIKEAAQAAGETTPTR